jgi:ribonuclease HII
MLRPFFLTNYLESGCDEAGRGCLAGPVTAAAVMLPPVENYSNFCNKYPNEASLLMNEVGINNDYGFDKDYLFKTLLLLNDSKQLSEKKRDFLRPLIEDIAVSWAVFHVFPDDIDRINILNASILGMQQATLQLNPSPKHLIVDGNRFNCGKHLPKGKENIFINHQPELFDATVANQISYTTIIKGDAKFLSIAAASVLAKTHRDDYMNKIDEEFPMYNWKQNKGYPTREHKLAIADFGLTKYHRKTFRFEL